MTTHVNYSKLLLQDEQDERRPIRELLAALARRYGIRNKTVLEVGSGLGFNLKLLKELGNSVLGFEGLSDVADMASSEGVVTQVVNLEEDLPLAAQSQDVILCLDVLEHLLSPEHCLSEMNRVLRQDGLIIVNVPNHFTLTGRLRILMGSGADPHRFFPDYHDWNNPHVRFFRHASLRELLACCGFSFVEDLSSLFPCVPLLSGHSGQMKMVRRFSETLARSAPGLFAGGFFVVAQKT